MLLITVLSIRAVAGRNHWIIRDIFRLFCPHKTYWWFSMNINEKWAIFELIMYQITSNCFFSNKNLRGGIRTSIMPHMCWQHFHQWQSYLLLKTLLCRQPVRSGSIESFERERPDIIFLQTDPKFEAMSDRLSICSWQTNGYFNIYWQHPVTCYNCWNIFYIFCYHRHSLSAIRQAHSFISTDISILCGFVIKCDFIFFVIHICVIKCVYIFLWYIYVIKSIMFTVYIICIVCYVCYMLCYNLCYNIYAYICVQHFVLYVVFLGTIW